MKRREKMLRIEGERSMRNRQGERASVSEWSDERLLAAFGVTESVPRVVIYAED